MHACLLRLLHKFKVIYGGVQRARCTPKKVSERRPEIFRFPDNICEVSWTRLVQWMPTWGNIVTKNRLKVVSHQRYSRNGGRTNFYSQNWGSNGRGKYSSRRRPEVSVPYCEQAHSNRMFSQGSVAFDFIFRVRNYRPCQCPPEASASSAPMVGPPLAIYNI